MFVVLILAYFYANFNLDNIRGGIKWNYQENSSTFSSDIGCIKCRNLGYADTIKSVSEDKLVGAGRWETAIEVSKKGWSK